MIAIAIMTRMHAAQMATPPVRLHDGIEIPQLGLTLFQVPPEETQGVVEQALEAGYRHFDTAAAHGNEREVGEALLASGLPREDYFVTAKLSDSQQGPQSTLDAFEASLERLGLDHVDLCLITGRGRPRSGCSAPGRRSNGSTGRRPLARSASPTSASRSSSCWSGRRRPARRSIGSSCIRASSRPSSARLARRARHRHRGLGPARARGAAR